MKLLDIVTQLHLILPKYTDKFSDILAISSISASGGVATITTTVNHNLKVDPKPAVTLADVDVKTAIDSVSKDGNVYTFGTAVPHDLTSTWPDHETITMEGFTDSAWNDTFILSAVPNRNSFKVASANTLPVLNGNEVLLEDRVDGVNGRYEATVTGNKTFTISGTFNDGTYTGGTVNKGVRVAGAIELDRAIEQYTKQNVNDFWMFVSMNDADISKDRHSESDATATRGVGDDMRLRLLDGFTLTIVKNVTKDIAAVSALDACRHDLIEPILKTLFGARFTTGLSGAADFKSVLTGHGLALYNKAILAYSYGFEMAMDLTNGDQVEPENTRAFRDIDLTVEIGDDDVTDMTVTVDTDEE
jgi:hypothetical protein